MNASKFLFTVLLAGGTYITNAQTSTSPIYVYMVAKQDAQHVLISEVMEVPATATSADLLALFQSNHPQIPPMAGMEGVRSNTPQQAEEARQRLKARNEQSGRSVTMLEKK